MSAPNKSVECINFLKMTENEFSILLRKNKITTEEYEFLGTYGLINFLYLTKEGYMPEGASINMSMASLYFDNIVEHSDFKKIVLLLKAERLDKFLVYMSRSFKNEFNDFLDGEEVLEGSWTKNKDYWLKKTTLVRKGKFEALLALVFQYPNTPIELLKDLI